MVWRFVISFRCLLFILFLVRFFSFVVLSINSITFQTYVFLFFFQFFLKKRPWNFFQGLLDHLGFVYNPSIYEIKPGVLEIVRSYTKQKFFDLNHLKEWHSLFWWQYYYIIFFKFVKYFGTKFCSSELVFQKSEYFF